MPFVGLTSRGGLTRTVSGPWPVSVRRELHAQFMYNTTTEFCFRGTYNYKESYMER